MTQDHPNEAYRMAAQNIAELDAHYPFPNSGTDEPNGDHAPDTTIIEAREKATPPETKYRTPALIHYPKASEVFIIPSGQDVIEQFLGFDCRAIMVQNLGTNGFLYAPDLGMYITSGLTPLATYNLSQRTQRLTLRWHTAAFNAVAPAAVPGQFAVVWLFDDWIPPVAATTSPAAGGAAVTLTGVTPPAALADALANPTTYQFGADMMVWNGATWDRVREPTADAIAALGLVSVGGLIFNGATWDRIREVSADAVAAAGLQALANMVWNGATYDRMREPTGDALAIAGLIAAGGLVYNGATWDRLREATADALAATGLPGAGNLIYNGATWDRLREATADALAAAGIQAAGLMGYNGATWDRLRSDAAQHLIVQDALALTTHKLISAATTNATSVKGTAGVLYSIIAFNLNAAARYLKIYNKATAPTVGTDVPVQTYLIPPTSSGFVIEINKGMTLGTGIAYALTTGITDADATAVAANEIAVNLLYN